jgi:hypothetical protein
LPGQVRLFFCGVRGLKSRLALTALSVLSALILGIHTQAQTVNKCKESASLWIPSQPGREKIVVKWIKPINYGIIEPVDYGMPSGGTDDARVGELIKQTLQFFASESGLTIESNMTSPLDLFIAVAPDISVFGPRIREYIEKSFEDSLLRKNAVQAEIKINPSQWTSKFRDISPKCGGISLDLHGVIERAHVVIQGDQALPCIEVALGELFGLANIRQYYADHDRNVPTDLVSMALRTLYDKRVRPGSDAAEAREKLGEVCE